MISALADFGFASTGLTAAEVARPDVIIQLGAPPNRIDLVTSIAGVGFETAWENRVAGNIDGIPVSFIGFEDLLTNKESTGRAKDLGDAEALRKLR